MFFRTYAMLAREAKWWSHVPARCIMGNCVQKYDVNENKISRKAVNSSVTRLIERAYWKATRDDKRSLVWDTAGVL